MRFDSLPCLHTFKKQKFQKHEIKLNALLDQLKKIKAKKNVNQNFIRENQKTKDFFLLNIG